MAGLVPVMRLGERAGLTGVKVASLVAGMHADLKSSALAHLPSGVFTANAEWLVR